MEEHWTEKLTTKLFFGFMILVMLLGIGSYVASMMGAALTDETPTEAGCWELNNNTVMFDYDERERIEKKIQWCVKNETGWHLNESYGMVMLI